MRERWWRSLSLASVIVQCNGLMLVHVYIVNDSSIASSYLQLLCLHYKRRQSIVAADALLFLSFLFHIHFFNEIFTCNSSSKPTRSA